MIDTIKKLGIDKTAEMLAEYINQKIQSEDVAMQFVLEELEAASQGNHHARQFVLSSGFDEDDYKGAMYNSFEEVDGEDGPQQEILNLCMMLYPNQELMAELRIKTVDHIMKIWELGKYAAIDKMLRLVDIVEKKHNLKEGVFGNISNDLNDAISEDTDILLKMAYGYARRVVAGALYLQGIFNKEAYNHAKNIFFSLQLSTGQSVEFQESAYAQALELLQSYDNRFNKNFNSQILTVIETNQVESAYDNGKYFSDEEIFKIFNKNSETKTVYDKFGNKYKEITSPYTGRIWLDRNLGAKRIPISYDDKDGFGYYFQWGRNFDGHENINSQTTNTLSGNTEQIHNKFIMPTSEPYDWLIKKNDLLWQGINGLNNPCPKGYRLPTLKELVEETVFLNDNNNIYGIFNDFLKIPAAGCRNNLDGKLYYENSNIFLWTSDTLREAAIFLGANQKEIYKNGAYRSAGANIRCIKD